MPNLDPPAYAIILVNPGRFPPLVGTAGDRMLYQDGMVVSRTVTAPVPTWLRFYDPTNPAQYEEWVPIGLTGILPNGDVTVGTVHAPVWAWPSGFSEVQVCENQASNGLRSPPVTVGMWP